FRRPRRRADSSGAAGLAGPRLHGQRLVDEAPPPDDRAVERLPAVEPRQPRVPEVRPTQPAPLAAEPAAPGPRVDARLPTGGFRRAGPRDGRPLGRAHDDALLDPPHGLRLRRPPQPRDALQ